MRKRAVVRFTGSAVSVVVFGFVCFAVSAPVFADSHVDTSAYGVKHHDCTAEKSARQTSPSYNDAGRYYICSTGVAITGNNNLRGKTVFSFEGIGAVTFGQFVGVWNPDGTLPFVIDSATPNKAILATIAPPGFPLYGKNAPNIPYQNLRFQDTPEVVSSDGVIGAVSAEVVAGRLKAGFGSLKSDYTLGQWLSARGVLKMYCTPDNRTEVELKARHLVPNGGIYTMWAFWNDNGTLATLPFGGSGANAFATDKDGHAALDLTIPFCALDTVNGVNLVAVQLDYHSDDSVIGTVPNLPLVPGRGPGIVGHSALIFPVRAQPCEEAGDCIFKP
ncbi:MAG: hypothetical protein KGJ55_04265 [Gammaproteobacteria bacterium]|nr:hypothetical protein [Gammaproteobacteria bacterium]